jgi:DNA-binding CsgD family transcriptional regulator
MVGKVSGAIVGRQVPSSERHLGVQMLEHPSSAATDMRALPSCPIHPGSLVRRYRTHGPNGPGIYPQCVPGGDAQSHLLAWTPLRAQVERESSRPDLSPSELDVLRDAAAGMTSSESAMHRQKSTETVKSQRKSILIKLGARNMTQAVAVGVGEGLMGPGHAALGRSEEVAEQVHVAGRPRAPGYGSHHHGASE